VPSPSGSLAVPATEYGPGPPIELDFLSGREVFDQQLNNLLNYGALMNISEHLMDILACPQCKRPVTLAPGGDFIICSACAVKYPVRDGIPVMLVDEAVPLPPVGEDR